MPPLELEALRLSLSNMHTAQLELTQANLQKEKETALTELREMLNGRHAQELALLQSRQRLELELIREQHAREQEEMALRCGQETGMGMRAGWGFEVTCVKHKSLLLELESRWPITVPPWEGVHMLVSVPTGSAACGGMGTHPVPRGCPCLGGAVCVLLCCPFAFSGLVLNFFLFW